MSGHRYPSWQRRHEAVLQFILSNPAARNAEVARQTGYSEWHISRIIRSTEFDSRLQPALDAARREAACRRFGFV